MNHRRALLLPVASSALIAGAFIGGRYAVASMGPLSVAGMRNLIALLLFAAIARGIGTRPWRVVPRDLRLLIPAGFGMVGYNVFSLFGFRYTALTNAGVINALCPVLTAFFAAVILRERLSASHYLGILIATLGVLVLISRGHLATLQNFTLQFGDGLMLLAVACWIVYALLVKVLSRRYGSFTISLHALVWGTVPVLLAAPFEHPWAQLVRAPAAAWIGVIYMGLATSGLGYFLYNLSVSRLGASRTVAVVYSLVPMLVALLSSVFFAEAITAVTVCSIGFVLLGLALMLRPVPPVA